MIEDGKQLWRRVGSLLDELNNLLDNIRFGGRVSGFNNLLPILRVTLPHGDTVFRLRRNVGLEHRPEAASAQVQLDVVFCYLKYAIILASSV